MLCRPIQNSEIVISHLHMPNFVDLFQPNLKFLIAQTLQNAHTQPSTKEQERIKCGGCFMCLPQTLDEQRSNNNQSIFFFHNFHLTSVLWNSKLEATPTKYIPFRAHLQSANSEKEKSTATTEALAALRQAKNMKHNASTASSSRW